MVTRQALWKSSVHCSDAATRHWQVGVESTRRSVVLARQAQIGLKRLFAIPGLQSLPRSKLAVSRHLYERFFDTH
jgi:hypothetical protein